MRSADLNLPRPDRQVDTLSLIERWKLMIGPDDENDVWAVAPEDDGLDAPDGYRVIEVVPASQLAGAVEALERIAGLKRAMETGPFPRSWGASDASKAVRLAQEALDRLGGQ